MAQELTPAQDTLYRLVSCLDTQAKNRLRHWWRQQGLPNRFEQLTDDQCSAALQAVDDAVDPPF